MGEVYLADDLTLQLPVALKLLPERLKRDTIMLSRLVDEVALARRVTHPNVCRVYDIGDGDGLRFLSMEYIDGEDLGALLRRIGRLPAGRAAEVGIEICLGLEAAHAEGILHRDLKPGNVMIDSRGRVKITDFGLARLSKRGIAARNPGAGTPAYMAPEQFAGASATPQSDLFALGLVLYRLFTGHRPFDAHPAGEQVHRRLLPRAPSDFVATLAPEVEGLILACLSNDPADRPSSALSIAEQLTRTREPATRETVLKTLVFTGLCGDVTEDSQAGYDALVRRLAREHEAQPLVAESGCRWMLDRPHDAVRFALAVHAGVRDLGGMGEDDGIERPAARISIHLGEVSRSFDDVTMNPRLRLTSNSEQITACLLDLAAARQTLLTRGAFDLARHAATRREPDVCWLAHGSYEAEGLVESIEICEVGSSDSAPMIAPAESAGIRRRLVRSSVTRWWSAMGLKASRRRNLVAVAGIVMANLIVTVLWVQSQHIARQAEASRQISDLLWVLFELSDPSLGRGDRITAHEIDNSLASHQTIRARMMDLMGSAGPYEQSGQLPEQVLEVRRGIHGGPGNPDGGVARLAAADKLDVLAEAFLTQGRYTQAENLSRQSLELRQAQLGERHPDVAKALRKVATSLMFQQRYSEAEVLYQRSADIYREHYGNDHPEVAVAVHDLAVLTDRLCQIEPACGDFGR